MYTAHYGLRIKPFQISSDAKFIWLGEKHKEALATLRYGILDNKGFLLLTGDVGTGKTTLINTLIGSLTKDVIYASVPDPSLERMDFFNYIAAAFGIGEEFTSKGKFLSSFSSFLHKAYDNNQKVLLIIDESQLLTQELLEEIRLLSNIVTRDSNPLLNIFFVGQYEFNELIRLPENRAIAQRLTLNYYIEPLSLEETGNYIRHRLKVAGTTEKIFNTAAVKEIYAFSNGFPRRINIICDHCLMSGYAEDKKTITGSIAQDSATELQIPEHRRGQQHESGAAPQQSNILIPSVSPRPADQSSQVKTTAGVPLFWPISGLFFILLLLMCGAFLFLLYTNTTYKEATQYLATIQSKIGLSSEEIAGKNSQAGQEKEAAVSDINVDQKSSSAIDAKVAAKITGPAKKKEPLASATADVSSQETAPSLDPSGSGKIDVRPVLLSDSLITDSSEKKPEVQKPSLPTEPLVIRFKYDSNIFSVSDIERMKNFARRVQAYPGTTINVAGYTDASGDIGYNKRLSEFRANMVKSFLMGQNLPPEQIKAQGYGRENPVARNDTAEGRILNRRVEITVVRNR
ncbi:MAG: AAA family ATPase [Desulforhopalus sp.]